MSIESSYFDKKNKIVSIVLFLMTLILVVGIPKNGLGARLKDVASVKGVRDNILIGYGIVVGLKGTGDSATDVTSQSLSRLFNKLGLDINQGAQVPSKNAAAVIVTGKLPAFSRVGNQIDVTVSSIGDATSLEGGTLLVTPLRAGDQNVYAVAQGVVSLGGLTDGSSTFPTVGRVVGGATIEKDLDLNFADKKNFRLSLNHADFTTAARVVTLINGELGGQFAAARDSGTIDVVVPFNYNGNSVELLAKLENIEVNIDSKAKVVLNERTGTVVMGENISIYPVTIAHGDLSIAIQSPNQGQNQNQNQGQGAEEKREHLVSVKGAKVSDLVKVLNTLGVKPKDLTAIFQTLRHVGALQSDLEIM